MCNLGSINLAAHVSAEGVDWGKLRDTIRTAVVFLDRVIDINFYPSGQAAVSNPRWRPVGLGPMGLQDAFFTLGLPFDSAQARELSTRVQEEILLTALEVATGAARQFGPHPAFAETRAAGGVLHPDRWGVEPTQAGSSRTGMPGAERCVSASMVTDWTVHLVRSVNQWCIARCGSTSIVFVAQPQPTPPGWREGYPPGSVYQAPPGPSSGPPHAYLPPAAYPTYSAPTPGRTRRRLLVAMVCVVGALICGAAVAQPYYVEYRLTEAYEAVGQPSGFNGEFLEPKVSDHPTRIEQPWFVDTGMPFSAEERAEKLYAWARNAGSSAPEQDFAACFAANCNISWVFQGDYRVTIFGVRLADSSNPLVFVLKAI